MASYHLERNLAVRENKNNLIAGFLLVLLTHSPVLALDPQAAGSLKAPPSSLLSIGAGKITGRVRVAGRVESPKPLTVFKNKGFCGAQVPNENFLVGSDGGVKMPLLSCGDLILKERKGYLRRSFSITRSVCLLPMFKWHRLEARCCF